MDLKLTKITKTIFIANIIAFVLTFIIGQTWMMSHFALNPIDCPEFNITQFISYMFLHAGLIHILFNMITFISFAPQCEIDMGSNKFLGFYILSGIISALFHIFMVGSTSTLVGASGAVFAVLYLYMMSNRDQEVSLFFIINMKAKHIGILLLSWEIIAGFLFNDNIAHFAHVGGALCGITTFFIHKRK